MSSHILLARADRVAITRAFPLLAALQPIQWRADGLLLMPSAAGDSERASWARGQCPVPLDPVAHPSIDVWPDPPACWVAGIYRRSLAHASAPQGTAEIIQTSGEGFGPGEHETTMMCLERLPKLPSGDALDVGCGSGLLGLAWARLGKGHVHAIDVDPRATSQMRASAHASGLADLVTVECTRIEALSVGRRFSSTILANVPSTVHLDVVRALEGRRPRVALISGIRPSEAAFVLTAYARLGLRRSAASRRGRWECHLLVSDRRDG